MHVYKSVSTLFLSFCNSTHSVAESCQESRPNADTPNAYTSHRSIAIIIWRSYYPFVSSGTNWIFLSSQIDTIFYQLTMLNSILITS